MSDRVVIEACVESTDGALAAARGGADRVELCAALFEGGLTPSYGEAARCRDELGIRLHVMVRPRGGDFLYTAGELDAMARDIDMLKRLGADGVVFGMLDEEGRVDRAATTELTGRARPLSVTFHRAFDMTRDPFEALETLAAVGVDRVLTSGQESTVVLGIDLIRALVGRAAGRVSIMPGGGLEPRHVARVVADTGVREIHVAGLVDEPSRMRFRNDRCYMGGLLRPPEYARQVTDAGRIAAVRAAAGGAARTAGG
jgi:copper homeostasis protein